MSLSLFATRMANGLRSALKPLALRLYSMEPTAMNTDFYKKFESRLQQLFSPRASKNFSSIIKNFSRQYTNRDSHNSNCKGPLYGVAQKGSKVKKRKYIATFFSPAECLEVPCDDILPRFDNLYYKPTDHDKRAHQQTWVEFKTPPKSQPKAYCPKPKEFPPIYRRSKKNIPPTACSFHSNKMDDVCSLGLSRKLPKYRFPARCRKLTKPADCKKVCCPKPSFTECRQRCPKPIARKECHCLALPTDCDICRYSKRKSMYMLPPPVPAWPPTQWRAR